MFFIFTISDTVRIPPKMFGKPLAGSVASILEERYHSKIDSNLGYVVRIFGVKVDGRGLVSSDGSTLHRTEFEALAFNPRPHEIVWGEIIEMTEFGAFVRMGPADAVLHLSQISHGSPRVDVKAGIIMDEGQVVPIRIGSRIRSRITAISIGRQSSVKIGLTCNEPTLGPEEWA